MEGERGERRRERERERERERDKEIQRMWSPAYSRNIAVMEDIKYKHIGHRKERGEEGSGCFLRKNGFRYPFPERKRERERERERGREEANKIFKHTYVQSSVTLAGVTTTLISNHKYIQLFILGELFLQSSHLGTCRSQEMF